MTPVLLAFLAGMFAGAGIVVGFVLYTDRSTTPAEARAWPRPYAGCDRCMSYRYRGNPDGMETHQELVHGRVLQVGRPASW